MEKQEKIVDMFNQIAPTYDKANRILSFGVDVSWRKNATKIVLEKFKNSRVCIVDVACGTGDMMGIWQENAKICKVEIDSMVGIDPSSGMLEVAREKFKDFHFIQAFADKTTLKDESSDILSISYGIRNVVQRKEALREFNRILRLGGYLVVLEFTKRENRGLLTKIRDFYLSKILPKIGAFISKNRQAYEYLPNSIENFIDTPNFKLELLEAGFEIDLIKPYSMEISTLFIAKKVKNL